MKLTNTSWEWARFHTYRSKANNTFVFNFTPTALGFEVYWGNKFNHRLSGAWHRFADASIR